MKETVFENKIGYFKVVSNQEKLIKLDFSRIPFSGSFVNDDFNKFVIFQLNEYFESKRTRFDIPIDISGYSPFYQSVWTALCDVDYGNISTYKNISEKIGKPKAMRAVGTAIGKNPIPIIIPCHRIIRADGKIGGFGLGVDIKKILLKLEQKDGCKKKF